MDDGKEIIMRKWQRFRRRLIVRTLRIPAPLFELDPTEVREAVEQGM